jgi:hypothetical protein
VMVLSIPFDPGSDKDVCVEKMMEGGHRGPSLQER